MKTIQVRYVQVLPDPSAAESNITPAQKVENNNLSAPGVQISEQRTLHPYRLIPIHRVWLEGVALTSRSFPNTFRYPTLTLRPKSYSGYNKT